MKTYNTGKVQIGLIYQSTARVYHDADALRLQSAFLNKRQGGWLGKILNKVWRWL